MAHGQGAPAMSMRPERVDGLGLGGGGGAGVDAVAGLDSIELSWDLMDDPDFYAFILYRAGPGPSDAFAPLGEPTMLPSRSDRAVRPSVSYRYALASVDRAGNVSARSVIVERGGILLADSVIQAPVPEDEGPGDEDGGFESAA